MDRRTVVYYNSRTQRAPVQKRRPRKAIFSRIMLALMFVGVVAVFSLATRPNSNPNDNNATAEQVNTVAAASIHYIDSPLQDVSLPAVGQTAIGTLEQGLIKKTENEQRAPIASITKVITALVLLDKTPLHKGETGEQITLTDKDLAYFNEYYAKLGTVTAVTVGESMSYYEGLQAMLLPSSNNMSDTLVDRFFENREAYVTYANDFLKSNGLTNTVVADASGFSPESMSTPTDLIKLGQLALRHPIIAEIVAQKNATLSVAGDVPNYNLLINEPDVIGIKPGATDEAGYCLLFAAHIPTVADPANTVIIATIGHTDRPQYAEIIRSLLQSSRDVLAQSHDNF